MKRTKGTRQRVPCRCRAPERRRNHFGGAWIGCPGCAGTDCAGADCAGELWTGAGKAGAAGGWAGAIGAGASFTTEPDRVERYESDSEVIMKTAAAAEVTLPRKV